MKETKEENEKPKIFLISDSHFYHRNIIRYCNRPFNSVQEMNELMIKKWNEVVSKHDIVIHLGDFASRGKAKEIRDRLNGIIILIRGNHDTFITENDGFMIVEGNLILKNFILSHRPLFKEEIPEGFTNIHGHIHDKESYNGINVSVERADYTPILISK